MYTWNWQIIWHYQNVFWWGALATISLIVAVIVAGTVFGFVLALSQRSNSQVLQTIASLYIGLFRALPILVLLVWIYYVAPILFNIRISALMSAWLALTLNLSAYVSESVRSGIESIPKGQYESALVLGMTPWQAMSFIILPQAIRTILPNLVSLYATQLKNTSLASSIGVNELLHQGNILISNTFRPLEIYTTVACIYVVLILPFILTANHLEQKLKIKVKVV